MPSWINFRIIVRSVESTWMSGAMRSDIISASKSASRRYIRGTWDMLWLFRVGLVMLLFTLGTNCELKKQQKYCTRYCLDMYPLSTHVLYLVSCYKTVLIKEFHWYSTSDWLITREKVAMEAIGWWTILTNVKYKDRRDSLRRLSDRPSHAWRITRLISMR